MNNKISHLEFIHNTINRMSASSFSIKGWTMALVVALFAYLASTKEVNLWHAVIIILPTTSFWVLNGFFLQQERLYRKLYDKVRLLKEESIDFSMKTDEFKASTKWFDAFRANTMLMFYIPVLTISIAAVIVLGLI